MAGKGPSPLLGYNTNIRRKGVLCHVQTEDSGVAHPHVITHVFTAGTIIGTRKASYKEHVEATDLESVVRKLMQQQHKAMCIALRDGELDGNLPMTRDTVKVEAFRDDAAPVRGDPTEVTPPAATQSQIRSGADTVEMPAIADDEEPAPAPVPVTPARQVVAAPPVAAKEEAPILELDLDEVPLRGAKTPPDQFPPAMVASRPASQRVAPPTAGSPAARPRPPSAGPLVPRPRPPSASPPPVPSAAREAAPARPPQTPAAPVPPPPPPRPPSERREYLREARETPPPPAIVQSKPHHLPADTTYKAQPRPSTPVPPARTPAPRAPVPPAARRESSVTPPPRGLATPRRASTPAPTVKEEGAGRYSSAKAPPIFGAKSPSKTQPPPAEDLPPPPPPKRRTSSIRPSIFGQDYISEKSLDEVILAYLSEEIDDK